MSEPNLRELKVRAQALKPSLKLGKAGLTPEFLAAFDDALTRTKLLKIRFEGFKEERKTVARELAENPPASSFSRSGTRRCITGRRKRIDGMTAPM